MNKHVISGILTALVGLAGLISVFAGGSQAPPVQWPYEAFQGVVFSLAWALGLPEPIAYLVAALLVAAVLAMCFFIGYRLSRLMSGGIAK